jgi:GDP-mannose 6-dehydrogenase
MDISIIGLGYVGTVTAACLSQRGHRVIGCDVQVHKVDAFNNGISTVLESGVPELLNEAHKSGNLIATTETDEAVQNSALSLVCVGTPSEDNGSINLSHLKNVCKQIGESVRGINRVHTLAIRSTVLPDSLEREVLPQLYESIQGGSDRSLRVCVNPEFLREGSGVDDFNNPPLTIIGEMDSGAGDALVELYEGFAEPIFRLGVKEALMVKYASNLFHALKIIFSNEIGALCQSMGIDSHEVMKVFCEDRRLNISHRYLKPGYAYGGSCLPKDLRAILYAGKRRNVDTEVLAAIQRSNLSHIEKCVHTVVSNRARRIAVLGLSFKEGTDDLRESPTVEIVERLIGKGLKVKIHDKDVSANKIFGSNLTFIQKHLPHLASLMTSTLEKTICDTELVLLTKPSENYIRLSEFLKPDQILVDLVRFFSPKDFTACNYISLTG